MASAMVLSNKSRWTYGDYAALLDDGVRYEVLKGELTVVPSPNRSHQRASIKLAALLLQHVDTNDLGEVYEAPFDVILDPEKPDPEIVMQPDLLFVSKSRLDIVTEDNVKGAPDLVVEIISSSTAQRDRESKFQIYEERGVKHYWIIDPDAETLEVFELKGNTYYLSSTHTSDEKFHPAIFPGLTIDLSELWIR
ncbi:MAG: Uma2 family endonuclease [bacterium]